MKAQLGIVPAAALAAICLAPLALAERKGASEGVRHFGNVLVQQALAGKPGG